MDQVLELIERAQGLVGRACEILCPITPLCPDWERLGRLYDSIKAEWHMMNEVRNAGGYDLDSDAKARLSTGQEKAKGD